jgi:TatA/E family protein of Tat protein translocase
VFGLGVTEILLILVVALLVLGPKRLPEAARSLGRSMAEFRRASSEIRSSLNLDAPDPEPPAPAHRSVPEPETKPKLEPTATPQTRTE